MTVIATFFTKSCTVHATDSLLTRVEPDGSLRYLEWEQTKIVQVRPWNGAIAYFGVAGAEGRWQTLTWLREQVSRAAEFPSPQAFAEHLAAALQAEFVRLGWVGSRAVGIGVHFSAYERIGDQSVPELFFIRNFADPTYGSLLPQGVRATRETWATIHGVPSDLAHGDAPRRLQVHEFLQREGWLRFNNGDPVLFNTLANSLQDSVVVLRQRGQLRQLGVGEYAAIAHRSVELVAEIQREIGRPEARRVGGRVHNLAVTPSGTYSSTSGDDT